MNVGWSSIGILLLREWFRLRDRVRTDIVNALFFWPVTYAICSGYCAPVTYFGPNPKQATLFFAGMFLLVVFIFSYTYALFIMQEQIGGKLLQYQVSVTSFFAVYSARFIVGMGRTMLMLLPFFPMAKLVLGVQLYTDELSWVALCGVITVGAFLGTAYGLFLTTMLKGLIDADNAWARYIEPLLWLGGLSAPLSVLFATSSIFGYAALCNPFMYVTEAVRGLFLPALNAFIPLPFCMAVVIGAGMLFTRLSYVRMRKQLDIVDERTV